MAKQQAPKTPVTTPKKKPADTGGGDAFSYLWRNLLITAVVGIVILTVYKANEAPGKMQELYSEYQQLAQSRGNEARISEIQQEFTQLQADTGAFKEAIRKYTRGYYWVSHDVAAGSLKQINEINEKVESGQMKPLTYQDKMGYKVGLYPLIKYVNENTPPNAVILLPEGDSLLSNTGKWNFVYDPDWMEYFLYPRLCLARGREKEYPMLANKITHVLIVGGKGYDLLKYDVPVEQRQPEAILPIDHPPAPPAQPEPSTQPAQPKQ
jgi:hypothetical protein